MTQRVLLVMALPQENAGGRFDDIAEVVYTGVGKVNAAFTLTRALLAREREGLTVINLGSAGSQVFKAGEVVCATRFFQHDMNATALGFALGQTPFENDTHLENGLAIPGLRTATCYTGDSFVTEKHPVLDMEIIDMEAYALAKVCQQLGAAPFVSLKFITDGADGQAASDWNQAVLMSAEKLQAAMEKTLAHIRQG